MESVQTKSVMIQSLCVPCFNRCRYCLLFWDGKVAGANWERSIALAKRYIDELKQRRPCINVSFSFGYSMEHPDLASAIQTLRKLGSPMSEFLQCDGMAMRDQTQCQDLMKLLKKEGIKSLNFTAYGLPDYHDRFAGRRGDFDLLLRMMRAACAAGIPFSTGVPITKENIADANKLAGILKKAGCAKIFLFIPHEEGRGKLLNPIRLQQEDLSALSQESTELLNRNLYRTESEWLKSAVLPRATGRQIILSFRADNIDSYEKRDALSALEEIEALDEAYYSAFPSFDELAKKYGDKEGTSLYRLRDLSHHYRSLFAAEHGLKICDVTDERYSGSRRYEG